MIHSDGRMYSGLHYNYKRDVPICLYLYVFNVLQAAEHAAGAGAGAGRWRGAGRSAAITLQCARCPYRGATHNQVTSGFLYVFYLL